MKTLKTFSQDQVKAIRADYINWIDINYPTKGSCVNKCNEAVEKMVEFFNNLTVQVGYVNGIFHCWCKDTDGNIVDPTIKQFEGDIIYKLIANRFLNKDEIELSTGAVFLTSNENQ